MPRKQLVIVLVLLLSCTVVSAGIKGSNVRGGILYSQPTGDLSQFGSTMEAEGAAGMAFGWELMFKESIGLNLWVSASRHEYTLDGIKLDDAFVVPVGGAVFFHLTPKSSVDFYVGPGIAGVFYEDLDEGLVSGDATKLKTNVALTVDAGIDVPLGDRGWILNFDLRYLWSSTEVKELGEDLTMNSVSLGINVGYRF